MFRSVGDSTTFFEESVLPFAIDSFIKLKKASFDFFSNSSLVFFSISFFLMSSIILDNSSVCLKKSALESLPPVLISLGLTSSTGLLHTLVLDFGPLFFTGGLVIGFSLVPSIVQLSDNEEDSESLLLSNESTEAVFAGLTSNCLIKSRTFGIVLDVGSGVDTRFERIVR